MELIILGLLLIVSLGLLFYRSKRGDRQRLKIANETFPPAFEATLNEKVEFFKKLSEQEKALFRTKILTFLHQTPISGAGTEIDSEIKVLVACSAVVPVFYFKDWQYNNLSEVIVYESEIGAYEVENKQINTIVGQVRPFQNRHIVLFSKSQLLRGFGHSKGKHNVGFHEFAHLIDEADGTIDGMPKSLLPHELIRPWTELMYKEIARIKAGRSDIDPYGVTNHAEFFAVVCEYFFENTTEFHKKYPGLYQILSTVFMQSKRYD